jgi:hypothetical protein
MKNPLKTIASTSFITFNKNLTKEIGINATLLLGHLCSLQDYFNDKPFFQTKSQIEEELTLNRYYYDKARNLLIEKKLIKYWIGKDSSPYFHIDDECLKNIEKIINNPSTNKKEEIKNELPSTPSGETASNNTDIPTITTTTTIKQKTEIEIQIEELEIKLEKLKIENDNWGVEMVKDSIKKLVKLNNEEKEKEKNIEREKKLFKGQEQYYKNNNITIEKEKDDFQELNSVFN